MQTAFDQINKKVDNSASAQEGMFRFETGLRQLERHLGLKHDLSLEREGYGVEIDGIPGIYLWHGEPDKRAANSMSVAVGLFNRRKDFHGFYREFKRLRGRVSARDILLRRAAEELAVEMESLPDDSQRAGELKEFIAEINGMTGDVS